MEYKDPRLPELYRKRQEIAEQISEIEEAEIVPLTAGLLGKCYRSRNCYSCPETEDDYWWIYTKVTAVDGRYLTCFQFERDKDGDFRTYHQANRYWKVDGEEITAAAFRAAWDAAMLSTASDFPA